jgi:flagellar biogenesis protein FliO
MSQSLPALPLLLCLLCLPNTVPAQPSTDEKPGEPPLNGVYDPENPNADADGFLWSREESDKSKVISQKSEVRSQKSEVRSEKSEVDSEQSGVTSEKSEVKSEKSAAVPPQPSTLSSTAGYLAEHYREKGSGTPAQPVERGSLASMFFQMFGGLGVVAGLFILGSMLLKRLSAKGGLLGGRGRIWQVIEGVPLGPKRTLYVTRFVDRIYLLAATEQQVTLLGEIQDPTLVAAVESGDADFRRFLVPESLATWKTGPAASPTANEQEKEAERALAETPATPEPGRQAPRPPRPRASKPAFSRPVTV